MSALYIRKGINSLNESFFEKLTPLSAYVFGFWMADGYMHHDKHYKISFSSKDFYHLENIKTAMGSNTKIYRCRKNGVFTNCYDLCLYSKKLFKDLLKLGGHAKKSTTLKFPAISKNLLPDFIRGYFDGDGSIHIITYKAAKNCKIYHELRSNFTCGNKKYIDTIMSKLKNEIGLPQKVIGQYGPHQFKLGYGTKSTIKLISYLYYPGNPLYLKRKGDFIKNSSLK